MCQVAYSRSHTSIHSTSCTRHDVHVRVHVHVAGSPQTGRGNIFPFTPVRAATLIVLQRKG